MSRYRPPRPKSSPYITPEGYRALDEELKYLWKEKRPEVTQKVSEAAALGDRSENAEYIYGKKQLREIDARIQFLSKRLDAVEVIDRTPAERTRVFFGAWVTLEDDNGEQTRYRIVGADEFGRAPEYISIDAPLSRAMIGKSLDDEISVNRQDDGAVGRVLKLDAGEETDFYTIVEIDYK